MRLKEGSSERMSAGPGAVEGSSGDRSVGVPPVPTRSVARIKQALLSVALGVVILVGLQALVSSGAVSDLVLPTPTSVLRAIIKGYGSGQLTVATGSTLLATILGFVVAAVVGVFLAAVLDAAKPVNRVLLPYIVAFQALPKIAVAPLVVLWLGFGITGKTFVVIIVCFFPILVNTMEGLQVRDHELTELFDSYGASRVQRFVFLKLPNAVPSMMAGFDIGILFALIGTVTAEFVGSKNGLGYLLLQEQANFNVPGMFAALVVLTIIGVVLHGLVRLMERYVSFWAR